MPLTKTLIRRFVLPTALTLKLDKYFLSGSQKNCCIVNFHGVRKSTGGTFNNRHIPVDEFEKIITYLKRTYEIVSLKDAFDAHKKSKLFPRKSIALTFDDGYRNNFEVALPILKKYNVPATFFIVSKGLITSPFYVWPDIVDLLKKHLNENFLINKNKFTPPGFYNDELELDLLNYLKTLGKDVEGVVGNLTDDLRLAEILKQQNSEYLQLADSNFLRIHRDEPLIEFGSHTHTHFCLEYLDQEAARGELVKSKETIERIIGKPVVSIAFPDGSYNQNTLDLSVSVGYTNLAAVEYKRAEDRTNPNLLSRFTISNSTTFESNALRLAKQFKKYAFC